MDAEFESELISLARRGDHEAFERLVAGHRRELYVHCYRMLGSVQDAEDALQEALLGAWRGVPGFEGRSSLRAWLYRISTNACLAQAQQVARPKQKPVGTRCEGVAGEGRIVEITGFLDPDVHRQVDVPAELPAGDLHAD